MHAQSILGRALRAAGVRGRDIPRDRMAELIAQLERASALFVRPREHKRLRDELAALWQHDEVGPELITVQSEAHIVDARSRARQLCIALGARGMTSQKVATVVSELARNIVLYTPGGEVELTPLQAPRRVRIRAADRGGGIDNLEEIFAGEYKSRTGLGCGLLGTRRVCNAFSIETGRDGTEVVVEVHI